MIAGIVPLADFVDEFLARRLGHQLEPSNQEVFDGFKMLLLS